jgi:hypothetical protein
VNVVRIFACFARLFGAALVFVACVDKPQSSDRRLIIKDPGSSNDRNPQTSGALNPFNPGSPYFCPQGSQYLKEVNFCVKDGMALGPFTKKMVELCKQEAPKGVDCAADSLPATLAGKYRGTGVCPAGATATATGFCAEGSEVYGPFVHERVDICKAEKGGVPCESNRWSSFFAEVASKVPDPIVQPPVANEEAFERYIAPPIYTLLREDKGLGYANEGDAQHSRDLFYNGSKIFSVGTKESHCVGMTFQVLMMAMNLYYRDTRDARVWNMPSSATRWEPFKNCWYVNDAEGRRCYGARDAIVRYGLGVAVKNFSELKVGDFVNYDRESGYGHSVIFMSFLLPGGKTTYIYSGDVVGFEYFSSQGSTDGAGKMKAYFYGESCPDGATDDCGILKNSLVMGRVLHPSRFVKQARMFSLASDDSGVLKVTVPLRYLFGNVKQK